jgi:hypothetical protein
MSDSKHTVRVNDNSMKRIEALAKLRGKTNDEVTDTLVSYGYSRVRALAVYAEKQPKREPRVKKEKVIKVKTVKAKKEKAAPKPRVAKKKVAKKVKEPKAPKPAKAPHEEES